MKERLLSRIISHVFQRVTHKFGGNEASGEGSILEISVNDLRKNRKPRIGRENPYNSSRAFDVADDIKQRSGSEEQSKATALALEEHHREVVGDTPPHLDTMPGVVVFDGARPRNEEELNDALENNKELKQLVGSLQEKGKNVWAQANAHKGVVLTVAAVAASVVGTGIYLHHKKEENKIGKASSLIFKKKK